MSITALLLAAAAVPGALEPEVSVALVSDAGPVTAGATFEVAALFEIEEEWHIYWRDPGDTGMATEATLTVPDGFTVEGPFFPVPEIIPVAGGMVSYAFEEELALFFRVTAPAELAADTQLEFGVDATWLVCKEACFLGGGEARLTFTAGKGGGASDGLAKVLQAQRDRIPRPLVELEGAATRWEPARTDEASGKHVLALQVQFPADELELIPDSTGGLKLIEMTHDQPQGHWRLVFETRDAPADVVARGVFVVATQDGPRHYALAVPFTAPSTEH